MEMGSLRVAATGTIHERIARLEEHIVSAEPPTVEEMLDEAETCREKGDETMARFWLGWARHKHALAELDAEFESAIRELEGGEHR